MSDLGSYDQAESLRRMLGRGATNLVSVTSGSRGVGKTSAVINIAAALSARGSRVLVIDENHGPANVAGLLGVRAWLDLNCVIHGICALDDAVTQGPFGFAMLPVAGGADVLAGLGVAEQKRLIADFGRLNNRFDFVLIDAQPSDGVSSGVFSRSVPDTIVVCSGAKIAITGAYALIKLLGRHRDGRRFQLLINRLTSEHTGRLIFDNMSRVAGSQLGAPLACLGCVPSDESVTTANAMYQPVVNAFPASPSATVFNRIAATMARPQATREGRGDMDTFMQRLLLNSRFALANAGA